MSEMKKQLVQEQSSYAQDVELFDSSLSELLMEVSIEEEGIEGIKQLLDMEADQGRVRLSEIYQLIPESVEDQKLLQEILEILQMNEIQVVLDEDDLREEQEKAEELTDIEPKTDKETIRLKEEFQTEAAEVGDTVGLYLSQASTVPLLVQEEEIELAKQIERGRKASRELARERTSEKRMSILKQLVDDGQAAREHLLLANVRLVFSVAKKYAGRGIPILDLVQEGHIGLMRATKKFDYRRWYKFSTYATWWIRQAISRYVADKGRTLRLPVHMGDRINRLLRVRHQLI
jgi:RNA polymerase primary sigma factor